MSKSFEIDREHWSLSEGQVALNVWHTSGPHSKNGTVIQMTHAEMRDMIRVCEKELAQTHPAQPGTVAWLRHQLAAYDDEVPVRIRVEDRDEGPHEGVASDVHDGGEWDDMFAGEPVIRVEE